MEIEYYNKTGKKVEIEIKYQNASQVSIPQIEKVMDQIVKVLSKETIGAYVGVEGILQGNNTMNATLLIGEAEVNVTPLVIDFGMISLNVSAPSGTTGKAIYIEVPLTLLINKTYPDPTNISFAVYVDDVMALQVYDLDLLLSGNLSEPAFYVNSTNGSFSFVVYVPSWSSRVISIKTIDQEEVAQIRLQEEARKRRLWLSRVLALKIQFISLLVLTLTLLLWILKLSRKK